VEFLISFSAFPANSTIADGALQEGFTMSPLDVPTPPWVTGEHQMFCDMVGRFMDRELAPLADEWEAEGIVARETWELCGQHGLLLSGTPECYGGGGGDFSFEAAIIDQSGRRGLDALNLCVQGAIFTPYLLRYGSEEQKRRWLPRLAAGEMISAIAMTEPGSGSDLQGIKTSYVEDGDNYVINGQKIFITNGIAADLILVACKSAGAAGAKGISLILVEPAQAHGFRRGRKLDKIGLRGQDTAELFFDDVRVPRANLLGEGEGQGFAQMMEMLPQERLVVALQAMAMIERALDVTLNYVKERQAFQRRLLDFQTIQFQLAEFKTEGTIAKVFCNHCVEQHLNGQLDATTASMAKYWMTELQGRIVDACLQLFGGYGYMNEFPIARMYRDARVSRIYGGTNEIMKLLIARSL
jgi:acyl-CoA dehydrogenase